MEQLERWLEPKYVPSEQDLFRFGREAIISKSSSSAVQFLEIERQRKSVENRRIENLQIISFDFAETVQRVLTKSGILFDSYIIFCVPLSDYDCFIGGKGFFQDYCNFSIFAVL